MRSYLAICFSSDAAIQYGALLFSALLQVSVSLDLVWQPGPLINMDGTISL